MVRKFRRARRGRKLSKKQAKQVKSMVLSNIETKHQIYNFGTTNITTDVAYYPVWSSMFGVQGAGQSSFIGNEVRLQRMRLRGVLTQGDSSNVVRIMLIRPTPKYDPTLGSTDIFNNAIQPLYSSIDRKFVSRIYWDRLYTLNAGNALRNQQRVLAKTLNFRNRVLDLTALGAPNEDLYWVCVSDSAPLSLVHPSFEMTHELQLKDA